MSDKEPVVSSLIGEALDVAGLVDYQEGAVVS